MVLALSAPAFAQSIFANLSGTVSDATGAVVPGAKVDVTNEATKVSWHKVSNSTGSFSVTELPVGTYTVTAEAKGFEKWVGSGIVLESADDRNVKVRLVIGAETSTVLVTATTSDFANTDSGAKVTHIDTEELERVALMGRNALEILSTIPGASQLGTGGVNNPGNLQGGAIGINGGSGMGSLSVNGQSGTGLSLNIDGQNIEDPGAPGGNTPVNPNPDMLTEVTVLTSNYGADSAKGPVVINALSKSGGSTIHGAAYFYARHSALTAEDSSAKSAELQPGSGVNPGDLKGTSHFYYPGGSLGGPVSIPHLTTGKWKDKVFFHESFEDYRQLINQGLARAYVPTQTMINNGDFSEANNYTNLPSRSWNINWVTPSYHTFGTPLPLDATNTNTGITNYRKGCTIAGGVLSSSCIDSSAQLWMSHSIPASTTVNGDPDPLGFNYVSSVAQGQNDWHNMVKLDFNLSDNTKTYVSWSRQHEASIDPMGLWQGAGDNVIPAPSADDSANTSDLLAANLVHVFSPSLTVEARFGYTHMDMPGAPANPKNVLRKDMGFPLTGVFGNANAPIATSWSGGIPNIGDIGHDYHPAFYGEKAIPSAGGDLTKVYKTHTAKFGAFWEKTWNSQDNWSQYMGVFNYGAWGNTSGNSYSDMLMGLGGSYYEQYYVAPIKMSVDQLSFYLNDHWKVTSRLTVDYGVRFEHWGQSTPDTSYGDAVFQSGKYASDLAAGSKMPGITWHSLNSSVSAAGSNVSYMEYSPRLGGIYDVFGNGKTLVRGGWGQYRYENYVVANSGAAGTAEGGLGWGAPGSAHTWEDMDTFKNTGGANGDNTTCAANLPGGIDAGNNNCAPSTARGTAYLGKPVNEANSSVSVVDPTNHDQPYTTTYSLTVDQKLPYKYSFEVGYTGTHSYKGQNSINLNYIPVGTLTAAANITSSNQGVAAAVPQLSKCLGMDSGSFKTATDNLVLLAQQGDGSCQQKYRPYPYYTGLTANESSQEGRYDSLQVSLNRSTGWLTTYANYTFAKMMKNSNTAPGFKDYGIKEYWSVDGNDRGHTFNAIYILSVPKLTRGSNFDRGLLGHWEISGKTQVASGSQITGGGISNNGPNAAQRTGSPDIAVQVDLSCKPNSGLKSGQFANPSCYHVPTTLGSIGTGARFPYVAGPMFWVTDLAMTKSIKVSEHESLDFRVSAFNVLNHALLSFTNGDNNLHTNFDSTGALQNSGSYPGETSGPCPGPTCTVFGYADAHYGHRTVEMSARFTF